MKIYKYLLIILTVLTVSCESDLLNKPPLTQIDNNIYWKSANDLENYVIQFYKELPAYGSVGSYMGLIGWDGTRGSDVQITSSPSIILNGTRAPVVAGGEWKWENIRDINIFFENYSRCEDSFDTYKHFLGEACFFKAWFYFEKVKEYGDVPWLSKPLDINSDELYGPRAPRTFVVDSILSYLDDAIQFMDPLDIVKGGNNRLSKEAALLFKSRVALYEGTWQKYHKGTPFATNGADYEKYFREAKEAAETLMSNDFNLSLYSNNSPYEDYGKLFSLTDHHNTSEVLLWKEYSVNKSLSHSFQIYVSDRTAGISVTLQQIMHYLDRNGNPFDYLKLGESEKGQEFLTKISNYCDPRLSQTIWIPEDIMWDNGFGKGVFNKPFLDKSGEALNNTGFQIKKGNDPKDPQAGGGISWSSSCETGHILFRYAEVLLNYAEATAELEEPVDYDKSINLLRKRAGMPDFKIQSDPYSKDFSDYGYTISDELREIRRERTVELGIEGFRYDDIRRWAAHNLIVEKRPKGYPFKESEWAGQNINYKTDTNGFIDPFINQIPNGYGFDPERDYLSNIPLDEITLNPNLTQNPGW